METTALSSPQKNNIAFTMPNGSASYINHWDKSFLRLARQYATEVRVVVDVVECDECARVS